MPQGKARRGTGWLITSYCSAKRITTIANFGTEKFRDRKWPFAMLSGKTALGPLFLLMPEWAALSDSSFFVHFMKHCMMYILHTCPKLWCNSCSKCYGMDCLGTYTSHMSKAVMWLVFKVLWNGLPRYILHTFQSCDVTRVQSSTEWTASVHTSHGDQI